MGNQGKDWTLWLLILLLHYTEWSDSSVYHGALVSQAQAQSRTRRQFQDEFFQPSFLTIATTLTSTLPYLALPLLPAHCPGEGGWVLTCGREYGERQAKKGWRNWPKEELVEFGCEHCRWRRGTGESMGIHKGALQDWGRFLWALTVLGVFPLWCLSEAVIRSHTLSLIPFCMKDGVM